VNKFFSSLQEKFNLVYGLAFLLMILAGITMFFLAQSGYSGGLAIILGILILINLVIILI
jgi:hypothetical protein